MIVRLFRCFSTNKQTMKYLNVAEKNDVAKTIAGLLSNGTARKRNGYSVYNKIYEFNANVKGINSKMVMTSVSGHLLELKFTTPYRNWRGCSPEQLFHAPVYKSCIDNFLPIKKTIEREIKSCQGLIIWTDCDREGENIGFEIIDVCKLINSNIVIYRAIFSEITTTAIRRALNNLSKPDKRLSDAVNIRLELDLRTGAAITRLQTLRLQNIFPEKIENKLISYGSCQIPTLGFVAERYKEIEAFVSEKFWKIKVVHTIDSISVEFHWSRNRLFDKEACEDFLMLCLVDPQAKIEKVTKKTKNKTRPIAMDTVTLEKIGSRKLKLTAKEIMQIAEKLYTKGIISYPRTETNQFSTDIDLKYLVNQHTEHNLWRDFAKKVMEWGPNPRNGNKTDNAHPPIHPTKCLTNDNLHGNESRIYELIVRHFLACLSKDATGSETIVNINIAGEKFTATGLHILERNYLDIYVYEKWSAKQIHPYTEGDMFYPTDISMHEGATAAPPLLTEADLITLMEKNGIGTDATHAEHINTIKERGYIGEAEGGYLLPGVIGMGLYESYEAMNLSLAKPELRANFEADLKKICLGEKDSTVVLHENIITYENVYKSILERISTMDEKFASRIMGNSLTRDESQTEPIRLLKCPQCLLGEMVVKQNRNKSFCIKCSNIPICNNVIWLPSELTEISIKAETCVSCNNSKLLKMKLPPGYNRSIFNSPNGWYKTCIICDNKFRHTFSIKINQGKNHQAQQEITSGNLPNSSTKNSNITNITNELLNSDDSFGDIILQLPVDENSVFQNNVLNDRNAALQADAQASRRPDHSKSVKTNKRKCGLCRKEGHTKLKCPERNEFRQD